MDRRRRPVSSEEVDYWARTYQSMSVLNNSSFNTNLSDTVHRVNRLISAWPTDDMPSDGITGVKELHKKLASGLNDIKANSERDAEVLNTAIEMVSTLLGLRRASESAPPEPVKRVKRPRGSSPAGRGHTPSTPRGSVGPQGYAARLNAQLPLQPGRLVAFHTPGEGDESAWILAKVVRTLNGSKKNYEVQDVEPMEDLSPGTLYKTTVQKIRPLADPDAPANSPTHLNAYPDHPAGSIVLALYPDTSCFYRAQVIAGLRESQGQTYQVKFEDDDDQQHTVHAQYVVDFNGV
ncbi:hypothetical protein PENSPDRAFT_269702 [Peniophora sp. CONT]|nr:hypothetical protein PENSPDRAFT_269702 [Peniophora sp. CONT]